MKTLACRDMGVDCDFVAKGQTDEEVVAAGMRHAASRHPEYIKELHKTMSDDDLREASLMKIKVA